MKNNKNDKRFMELREILDALKKEHIPGMTDPADKRFKQALEKLPERSPVLLFKLLLAKWLSGSVEGLERVYFAMPQPARIAVPVTVLAMLIVFSFMPETPYVHDIKGKVKIFDAGTNTWMFAQNKMRIDRGDIVKTFDDGIVDISYGAVYSMRLRRDSELKVAQLSKRALRSPIRFFVDKGKVLAYCDSRKNNKRKFLVETDEVLVQTLGTDFMVSSMPQYNKTWVGVLNGMVKVTSTQFAGAAGESDVFVKAMHKTEVQKGAKPDKPVRMLRDEWLDLEELYSIGRKPQVALLISGYTTRTRELLEGAHLYISDKKPSILPDKLMKAADMFDEAVTIGSKEKHRESIKEFLSIVRKHPNPQYDVPFLLFVGAYYNRIGDHKEAIGIFEEVVKKYPKSRIVSIAQCAIGVIYEEKLNDMENAKMAYQRVLDKYPASPEAELAITSLSRL